MSIVGIRMRAVAGEASFEAMYRAEFASMVALGATLTDSAHTGADLANEAMLRAYKQWAKVGVMERPGAWVRRVVINLAHDTHRRNVRQVRGMDRLRSERPPDGQPSSQDFWAAVRELPERQRAAVVLRYVDDMPIDEIAAVLDVSDGTIKSSLFAARKTLATTLGIVEDN